MTSGSYLYILQCYWQNIQLEIWFNFSIFNILHFSPMVTLLWSSRQITQLENIFLYVFKLFLQCVSSMLCIPGLTEALRLSSELNARTLWPKLILMVWVGGSSIFSGCFSTTQILLALCLLDPTSSLTGCTPAFSFNQKLPNF